MFGAWENEISCHAPRRTISMTMREKNRAWEVEISYHALEKNNVGVNGQDRRISGKRLFSEEYYEEMIGEYFGGGFNKNPTNYIISVF